MESSPPTITVQVKFAGRTIPVEVPSAATTAELKRLLQPLTNVLPRGQKLEVPEEVWDCGPSVRILDVSNNCIKEIPHKIASLKSLNKLLLTANDIDDENISWEALSCLQKLLNLSLSQNRITSLPSSIGDCESLTEVDLSSNLLTELPETFGKLCNLKVEGWEEFDERRRQKHQKQLDFRVGSSGVFDEGADDDNRRR
nr:unnamed protein product [Digitaria exilis]